MLCFLPRNISMEEDVSCESAWNKSENRWYLSMLFGVYASIIAVCFSCFNLEVIPNEDGILQTCWGFFTASWMGDTSYRLSDSQAPAAAAEWKWGGGNRAVGKSFRNLFLWQNLLTFFTNNLFFFLRYGHGFLRWKFQSFIMALRLLVEFFSRKSGREIPNLTCACFSTGWLNHRRENEPPRLALTLLFDD